MSLSADVFFESNPDDGALVIDIGCQGFGTRAAIHGDNEAVLSSSNFGPQESRSTIPRDLSGRWVPVQLTFNGGGGYQPGVVDRFSVDGIETSLASSLPGVCLVTLAAESQVVRLDNVRITGRCR